MLLPAFLRLSQGHVHGLWGPARAVHRTGHQPPAAVGHNSPISSMLGRCHVAMLAARDPSRAAGAQQPSRAPREHPADASPSLTLLHRLRHTGFDVTAAVGGVESAQRAASCPQAWFLQDVPAQPASKQGWGRAVQTSANSQGCHSSACEAFLLSSLPNQSPLPGEMGSSRAPGGSGAALSTDGAQHGC